MPDIQKKKRKAMSIQDTANLPPITDEMIGRPKRRDTYSGPRKAAGATAASRNAARAAGKSGSTYVNTIDGYGYSAGSKAGKASGGSGFESMSAARGRAKSGSAGGKGSIHIGGYKVPFHAAGILDYAWIPYCVVLALCLMTSMIVAGRRMSTTGGYYIPRNMISFSGILNTIYDDYYSGGLGSKNPGGMEGQSAGGEAGDATGAEGIGDAAAEGGDASGTDAGGQNVSALPNSTTGATMALDDGTAYGTYATAASHEEVVQQLSEALAAGDSGYVGRKLAYADEASGQLIGYPQSVVEHFTLYMSLNADKRQSFINEISGESFAGDYNGAHIVKLPLIKFTVNMGYDDTKLVISGFSEQTLNAGQSATVQPLLPCMYTIAVSTSGGSQSSEVEANMNEGNLQINIGVSDQQAQ